MTNEEAVETLKQLILQGTDERLKKDYEALDIAIKALETGEVYMTGEDYNLYMEGYKDGKSDFEPKQGEYVDINKLRLMTVEECAGHTIDYAMGWKACVEWIKKGGAE